MKVVVSDYALAHWYCQIFKLDINNLTQAIPSHMTTENYKRVKDAIGKYVHGIQREPEPEQAIYKSYLFPQYEKRHGMRAPPAHAYKDEDSVGT